MSNEKPNYKYSISNLDDLMKNGGGQVQVYNETLKQAVPFKNFGISIENNTASIGYIEKDSSSLLHKGAGIESYKLLGDQLGERGVSLHSSDALLNDGQRVWASLVSQGKAERVGAGYQFKAPASSVQGTINAQAPNVPPVVPNPTVSNTSSSTNTNSVKGFFDNVKAFDVETTRLNTDVNMDPSRKGQIWQVGLAGKGVNQGKGIEAEINPFYVFEKDAEGDTFNTGKAATHMDEYDFRQRLTLENGEFSKNAYKKGNFDTLIDKYMGNGSLATLDESIDKTLGTLGKSDVVVLQNMNFENNMLKSAYIDGLISSSTFSNVQSRMETLTEHPSLAGVLTDVFQRPANVQKEMRQAERLFHKEYLITHEEKFFDQYVTHTNKAMDAYESVINNGKREGAVAVELMDITKAFYANAAQTGHIEKGTAQLGLSVDFLSQALGMGEEAHTALSDSNKTIDIFRKLWDMTKELRSGKVSDETKGVLQSIKSRQVSEVNRKFYSSISSTLNDFKERGYTKRTSSLQWYSPEVKLYSKTDRTTKTLVKESIGSPGKQQDLHIALNDVLEKYNVFEDNLLGVNRKEHVENILGQSNGSNYGRLYKEADKTLSNYKPPTPDAEEATPRVSIPKSKITPASEMTSLFGKEIKKTTKASIIGGAILGMGYMYSKSEPAPKQKPNDTNNVSYQFYDDQYLGSAFVDFRERNKHYMM